MKELIIATTNQGKLRELQALLAPIKCLSQKDLQITEVEETGASFIENALIKARHASLIGQMPALADDSGLVVEALNGEPGIFSARFAGPKASDADNIHLLLEKMKDFPFEARKAYFYCAIVLVKHAKDPTPIVCTGKLSGHISVSQEGEKGFGYDPVFYVDSYQTTLANLDLEIKNQISHRAKALKMLKTTLDL